MDSLSQIALGSAITVAVIGRRAGFSRAAAWGAVAGTLPDLDALIDFGDPILNMVRHRAESHSLFYLSLAAPLLGALISAIHGQRALVGRWVLAIWLALFTHPLLDWFTVYGTQLLQPFTDHPFGLGSVFIIDPAFTLPLLLGLAGTALLSRSRRCWRPGPNAIGLALAGLYLGWSAAAQQHVSTIARQHLPADDRSTDRRLLVTPAPFNTLLWRLVVVTPTHYHEGWYSLFDPAPAIRWQAYDRGAALMARHLTHPGAARIAAFSHGFFSMNERDGRIFVTDLRMGQEPYYAFRFDLGPAGQDAVSTLIQLRPPIDRGLPWLWQRMLGNATLDPLHRLGVEWTH
jgi:inner membrane protein